ncbi:SDR family oxidoreductase [Pseudoroseomonas globiformis]|uniref:SDR family oxidoreductase n=1 Tax=Teichococcus globiformis TaxID=2307229 RepID=A0ABV7G5C8_9PROT
MHHLIPSTIPRTALVTGSAKRIGRAICLQLAEAGFDLALHYSTSQREAEELKDLVESLGRRAVIVQAALDVEAEAHSLVPAATDVLGPLGLLVNNASTFIRDEWFDADRALWDHHLEPNLRAPFVLTQAMARTLPQAAEGVVINMLDQRVLALTPHFMTYTLSKAGLWALTQSLALALAPRIRVNGIGPGPTLPSPGQSEEQFERQAASTPLGRGASPEEVAQAVIMILALPAMTGQIITLDGGQHLQWSPSTRRNDSR